MYKQKIGISTGNDYALPIGEVLKIIKSAGFEAISPAWRNEAVLEETVGIARELGLELQSLHAPFGRAADMWSSDEAVALVAKNELLSVVDSCVKFGIPVMVVHVWKGFDYTFDGESLSFAAFDALVEHAGRCGVKIAFENTEGLEYLLAVMERYEGNPTVGFCWDSGHEMCYNYSEDILGRFADRLYMTHLNDNLGVSRYDGKTYWTDDLHLLPYDGIADWDYNIERLRSARPLPILNLELVIGSKPGRHDNDTYAKMSLEEYFAAAYNRACRIAHRYTK